MTVNVTQSESLSRRVGMEIKVLLVRRGMSGRRLAQELGESQTWLSTRLIGATPLDLNDLGRIAEVLGVSVHDLIPGGTVSTTAQQHTSTQTAAHAASFTSPRGIRSRRRLAGSVAA